MNAPSDFNIAKRKDPKRTRRLIIGFTIISFIFFGLYLLSGIPHSNKKPGYSSNLMSQDELFDVHQVRDVHLIFTDTAWKTMQPYGGPFGINGEGVGWWNLGALLAPHYMRNGDANDDGNFSHEEFMTLGELWFDEWDTTGQGQLTREMIGVGYARSFSGINLQGQERNGIGRVFGIVTPSVQADLQFEDLDFQKVSVRYKGNGTLMDSGDKLKRPIKVDLNDGFKGRTLAGVTKLNFHNMITDGGYMNDVIAYRLFREAGIISPRTAYAQMNISASDTLDREYIGLYLIVENVDNNFAEDRYGTNKGVIFKPVTPRLFEYLGEEWNNKYERTYDTKTPLSIQETSRIIELCKLVTNGSDEEFSSQIWKYIDLDNFARYMAIDVMICDTDGILGPGQNMYLYLHPKTFLLSFIPWDHDQSFGSFRRTGTQEVREQLSIHKPWNGNNTFLERMFKEETFKKLYLSYLEEFNETLFRPEQIKGHVDQLAKIIRPSIELESKEKLEIFDYEVGWNIMPNDPKDSVIENEPKPLRFYAPIRYQSVKDQLSGKSEGLIIPLWIPDLIVNGFMKVLDADSNQVIPKKEYIENFEKLFYKWAVSDSLIMTKEELEEGINTDFSFMGPNPLRNKKRE